MHKMRSSEIKYFETTVGTYYAVMRIENNTLPPIPRHPFEKSFMRSRINVIDKHS